MLFLDFKQCSITYSHLYQANIFSNTTWVTTRGVNAYLSFFDDVPNASLRGLIDRQSGNTRLVDFGCGIGSFGVEACTNYPHVSAVGVVYSQVFDQPEQRAQFNRLASSKQNLKHRYVEIVGDAHDPNLYHSHPALNPGTAAGVVDVYGVITYSPKPDIAICRALDLLKEGGLLYITTSYSSYTPLKKLLPYLSGGTVIFDQRSPTDVRIEHRLVIRRDPGPVGFEMPSS